MKKILLSAALAVAAVFSLSAEVLSPYVVQFDGNSVRPKGWYQGGGAGYSAAKYELIEEGGHPGSYISVNQYSNYYSSYYNNYNYNDILVTPQVEGEISIWVRKNGTEPTLTFYNIADPTNIPTSASAFERLGDTPLNVLEGKDIDEWTQITVSDVPAGTYVGIRGNNVDLDDFEATSADVVYRASLEVKVDNQSGTALEANDENLITIKFKVTITNTGDVDFAASEEGFKVELTNATADNALFGTGNITEAIPCGETVVKEFEMTNTPVVAPNTTSNNYRVTITHALTNAIETSLGYFTVIPYLPNPKFMFFETNSGNQSSYNDVNITGTVNIGAGAEGTARTLWMWNSGTAPLTVTAVSVSEGFTTDAEPFTLAKDEKKAINVALAGEAGVKYGKITFTAESLGELQYDLAGVVLAEGEYYQDFEGEAATAGMVVGKGWSLVDAPELLRPLADLKYLQCTSTYSMDRVVLPLLSFNEGDKLAFMATKSDNYSSKLNVYTSTDRVNWNLVYAVATSEGTGVDATFPNDKPSGSGYGTYEFGLYNIDMPEGNYYVAFEAGGVRLDNIAGGKVVDVAHDVYVVSTGLPQAGAVNSRFITAITLRNILTTSETDYDVVLEVNGEVVAHATETPEFEAGAELTFDIRYTPHFEGDYTGTFVFVAGDERQELTSFDFSVEAEKAESTVQVGVVKITATDPLNTYYNAQGQIIYRADQLGLDAGVKIAGFYFTGYNTSELTKHVKVWIANTDVEGFDSNDIVPLSKDDMTLVYDSDYSFPVGGSYSPQVLIPMLEIPFDAPFVYEGKSICIMTEQTNLTEDQDTHNVFFAIDNSAYDYWNGKTDNRVIRNNKEYAEDLDDEASWSIYPTGFPVAYIQIAKDVVEAKGTVTDQTGAPVENVLVQYTSDDILYQAYTDVEGAYSIDIINTHLVYDLTASAEEYAPYVESDIAFDPASSLEFVKDITLTHIATSLDVIDADAKAVVTVNAGVVTVTAPAGTPVKVYSVAGACVGSALSEGKPVSFGPLAPGVYVACGVKIVVR